MSKHSASLAGIGALLLSGALLLVYACGDEPTAPDAKRDGVSAAGAKDDAGLSAKPGGVAGKHRLTLDPSASTDGGVLTSSRAGLSCTVTYAAGTVSTTGTCAKDIKAGMVLSVMAAPSPGGQVTWEGCDTPVTDNPLACLVTMSGPRTVKATFIPPPKSWTLTIGGGANGSGTVTSTPAGISCTITAGTPGSGCSGSFPYSSDVTLTASAGAGSYLKAWSGGGCDATGTGIGGPGGSCTLNMSQSQSLLVSFATASDEAAHGLWSAPTNWGGLAIHASLLPNGKVLSFGRMSNPPILWDPAGGGAPQGMSVPGDLFCSGHTLLADGRLLVAGGHSGMDNFGTKTTYLFDPAMGTWSRGQDMSNGRWYPTNTTLATGEVLSISGGDTAGTRNLIPEVWQNGTWRRLTGASRSVPYYPMMFLAPDGRVFMAGPDTVSRWLATDGTGLWTTGSLRVGRNRDYGSAVMYDGGKVLMVGGGNTPQSSAEVIDLNGGVGAPWRAVGSLSVARRQLNATLLADGTVLATGGSNATGFNPPPTDSRVLDAEIWDPTSEQWHTVGRMSHHRLYHATALLLPDGRVLSIGSGAPAATGYTDDLTMEIFSPPYLFKLDGTLAARPEITDAPVSVSYGQTFTVQTPQAATIQRATWIRLSSVTHSFNQNQRMNRLAAVPTGESAVSITAPWSANLAPPGHYMLFLIDQNGVPSVAKIIRIG